MGELLRVGIINLMPAAEAYEAMLLGAFAQHRIAPIWIRLRSHGYASSDAEHLARHYVSYERAGALDGLILTGAPVEELAFEQVRYFAELRAILEHARSHVPSTLGLCWGGMALAHLLGIGKRRYDRKLFGVYPLDEHGGCAQSRHAGLDQQALRAAVERGIVRVIAGDSIVESADRRYLIHLGHPEYTPARLRFEYERDRALGREDVGEPYGVGPHAPSTPLPHGYVFFARWLAQIACASSRTSAPELR
jgi:homoserine O-succinyltransferase